MATSQKIYADLDLTFNKTPVTKDVAIRYDDQAVISSIRNLLLTNYYDKPFDPNLGSNLSKILFEPATVVTASIIADEIKNVLANYEPRAILNTLDVTLNNDGNGFNVALSVFIGNNTTASNINILLQRSR
jgi:hypothetical protein